MVVNSKVVTSKQLAKIKSKKLSSDSLFKEIRQFIQSISDHRAKNATVSLKDNIMTALAVFSLKGSSLLEFYNSLNDPTVKKNIRSIYKIDRISSDTSLRETLDGVDPAQLKKVFKETFNYARANHAYDDMHYLDGDLLLSVDGTGFFSSSKINCKKCMQKVTKSGKTTFYHQLVAASIVHPDQKFSFLLDMEEIGRMDGNKKNDCERNASKRLVDRIRREHPRLKITILEDGLASNAPHLKCIMDNSFNYITVCKPGDHKFLYKRYDSLEDQGLVETHEIVINDTKHCFSFAHDLPLNESNQDVLVNFLKYSTFNSKGERTYYNTWVTNLELSGKTVQKIANAGRTRWKVENETFNALKNQGYNFEHNFGHGEKNLATNFAILAMLAHLIDQLIEKFCNFYRELREAVKAKKTVWSYITTGFRSHLAETLQDMYIKILEKLGTFVIDTG